MIAIDGNIGCGKSTVLKTLCENYCIFPEDITSWGKWLPKYYENPKQYAMGFQLTVLLSHLRQQQEPIYDITFYERCSHTCNRIFGSLLVDDGIMEPEELELCVSYERQFNKPVEHLIYLRTTPEVCMQRIKSRDRDCETSIDIGYLKKLHDKYEEVYNTGEYVVDGINIHIVDANAGKDEIMEAIHGKIEMIE